MIKNLVFDVGNVLMEYRWAEALEDTGLSREVAADIWNKMFDDELWVMHDAGTVSKDELIDRFGERFPEAAQNIKEFIIHGERMPIPRPEIWEKIHRLKLSGYKIYLLSNYSEYLFEMHTKDLPFMADLDGKVVSYEIHQVKPDEAIYLELLNRFGLKAEECVFFDDREENTDTAQRLGIKSYTVLSREHLNKMLDDILEGGI